MKELSPIQIVSGFNRGDRNVFGWVWNTYYIEVLNHVLDITHDRFEARDLVSEVFARALKKPVEVRYTKNIGSFLFEITKNVCLNHLKKQDTRKAKLEAVEQYYNTISADDQESNNTNAHFENLINQAIENLPRKCRTVFQLYYYKKLSNREIGLRIGISEKTVANLKNKAKKILRMEIRKKSPFRMIMLMYFL